MIVIPNWTSNKIICKKSIGDKILIKDNDKYIFDFNKLIPMPQELQVEAGSSGEKGLMYLYIKSKNDLEKIEINKAYKSTNLMSNDIYRDSWFEDIEDNFDKYKNDESFKDSISLGEKYLSNYKKHGYCHWYDWCNANWGTKWNVEDEVDVSYNDKADEYEINFCTAWSIPVGIVKKYSELCNDDEFYWEYQDEDSEDKHILKKINDEIVDTVYSSPKIDNDFLDEI